jgi:hypothetical protein
MSLQRLACIPLLFIGVAAAGINWKSVWVEPRTPVVLTAGETKPYTVMGLSGADTKADLTKSPHVNITSSDPSVLGIDLDNAMFIGKKPGHVEIRIVFSEATETVPAFVRQPKSETTGAHGGSLNSFDGVWKAVFTGSLEERPKMVSEIIFDVNAHGSGLTGTVHAAAWPGDAAVSDGKTDGDRVTFTMTGHLPFQAGRPGAMIAGYPKLCFTGVRHDNEMKIDLLWTEAGSSCESGRLLPMAGKKLTD